MSTPFLGEIIMCGFNFAPRNWAYCDGQVLPINQNQSLYSLLGTTYGGDGRTSFALPDLRGRIPMHYGNGPGLSNRALGAKGGSETITLNTNQLPAHTHNIKPKCDSNNGTTDEPSDNFVAAHNANSFSATSNGTLGVSETEVQGGGQALDIMQPYAAIRFIIALVGQFPSRN